MTSWQTRPAAGVALDGRDRQGSNLPPIARQDLCIEGTLNYSFLLTKIKGHMQLEQL